MLDVCCGSRMFVHRRIGGLETQKIARAMAIIVHRRIGGLEKLKCSVNRFRRVHRRIGGLEISAHCYANQPMFTAA